jgi:1-acyl-sn-glycerol-3-phosphate acyltransferase
MLHFLPSPVLLAVAGFIFFANTLLWCSLLFVTAFAKLLLPHAGWREYCTQALVWIAEAWVDGNNANIWLTQRTEWDVQPAEGLDPHGSYLVVSNHRSSVDIPVLQRVLNHKLPFLRFVLKRELIRVPLLGLAWWILDFPFMRRHSRGEIEKRPELRGRDLEAVRLACDRFRGRPLALLSFLEGTRFTPEKREERGSPYRHLLRPRAGGIAGVIGAMGERLDGIVDVTILYSEPRVRMKDLFGGRVRRIVVRWRLLPVPRELLGGDYGGDEAFRARFQAWVNRLWEEKDQLIETLLGAEPARASSA